MIGASQICAVQQMHAPILGGRGDQSFSFVLEDDRRGRKLLGVGRIPPFHRQRFWIERDQRVWSGGGPSHPAPKPSPPPPGGGRGAGKTPAPTQDPLCGEDERPHPPPPPGAPPPPLTPSDVAHAH